MNHLSTIKQDLTFIFMSVAVEAVIFKENQTAVWLEMNLNVKF